MSTEVARPGEGQPAADPPVPPGPAVPRGGGSTRGRPARHSPESLLEVVAQVFNERGYDAASMEDLARASGLTKSAFYHHVSGKEQLLRMAVHRGLDALAAVLDEADADPRPAVDRLETVLRRTAEVLVAELPYVTLLLRVRGNTAVEREALEERRRLDARLAQLVREAADGGWIRDDVDPRLAARLLFGMVNSLTEWYRQEGASSAERAARLAAGHGREVVDAVVAFALAGLRRP